VPRVDRGFLVVNIEHILELSLDNIKSLVEWALKSKPLLVTSPSIIRVNLKSTSLQLTLGVGSLISNEKPNVEVKTIYEVVAPNWIDGCRVGARNVSYTKLNGPTTTIEGLVRAIDFKDPIALLINGVRGTHSIVESNVLRGVIAVLEGKPAVYRSGNSYISLLVSGEAAKRVDYIAPLASSCERGAHSED